MDYQQALDYLDAHTNFEARPADVYSPERFNPARTVMLLDARGNPHTRYPSVHIAGSKGKGSVAAMTEGVFRAAGYRTGLFTSPHLSDFRERLQIDRELITEAEFAAILTDLQPQVDAIPGITFFEIVTCAAFEWFARAAVDVAVLEVGLGGRLDPTNVVTPEVCAITSISLEHMALLGDTVEAIAGEKAGIIKPRVPVVIAPQSASVLAVFEAAASECAAPIHVVGRDWLLERAAQTRAAQRIAVAHAADPASRREYELALHGPHQAENAAVVVALVHELARAGWKLSYRHVAAALRAVEWPARFEILPGDPVVVVDAAHNRASAVQLRATVNELFPGAAPVVVFGALQDKDARGILAELLPLASHAIMTKVEHPRAVDPMELLHLAAAFPAPVSVAPTVAAALPQAMALAGPGGLVLVAGSVFVAGAARAFGDALRVALPLL